MISAGLEPAIPTIKRLQTYALDRMAEIDNPSLLISMTIQAYFILE
jgi:hypothetical protein